MQPNISKHSVAYKQRPPSQGNPISKKTKAKDSRWRLKQCNNIRFKLDSNGFNIKIIRYRYNRS